MPQERQLLEQIAAGEIDQQLVAIADAVEARLELLHTVRSANALAELSVGDAVMFTATRPLVRWSGRTSFTPASASMPTTASRPPNTAAGNRHHQTDTGPFNSFGAQPQGESESSRTV